MSRCASPLANQGVPLWGEDAASFRRGLEFSPQKTQKAPKHLASLVGRFLPAGEGTGTVDTFGASARGITGQWPELQLDGEKPSGQWALTRRVSASLTSSRGTSGPVIGADA